MQILLTGATGYLGSKLLAKLLEHKHNVTIIIRKDSQLNRIINFTKKISIVTNSQEQLDDSFKQSHFDLIVHTATQYGRNNESDADIIVSNFSFPLNLVQLAIKHHVPCFVNIDTALDKYVNVYAMSKSQFKNWGKFYTNNQDLTFINVELDHFFGPGDHPNKFVTWLIHSCLKNKPLDLTKGEQKRDFIYIDDVIDAILLLCRDGKDMCGYSEFQVATGKQVTIRRLVELVRQLTNSQSQLNFGTLPYRQYELIDSTMDISKITQLGWTPKYSLKAGLDQTIDVEKGLLCNI